MTKKDEVAYIKRGQNLLIYGPWAMDKWLMLLVAATVILGPIIGIWNATILGTIGAGVFLLIYFTACRFVGKWDYINGTPINQSKIEFENNPEWQTRWNNMEAEVIELRHEVQALRGNLINILTELRKRTGE